MFTRNQDRVADYYVKNWIINTSAFAVHMVFATTILLGCHGVKQSQDIYVNEAAWLGSNNI